MHAGLGTVDWTIPTVIPVDRQPLAIALVQAPTRLATPAREPSRPSAPRARPVMPNHAVTPVPAQEQAVIEEALCPPSDAAVIEEPANSVETVVGSSPASDTTGGAGAPVIQRSSKLSDTASGGSLIKAIPRYESNPLPHYPRLARQNRWEGTVRLRAMVTAGGDVKELTLERSSGHALLDRSALDGVQHWRFIPATRGGVPVACEVSIPVAFRLQE
jgi:protein TonB